MMLIIIQKLQHLKVKFDISSTLRFNSSYILNDDIYEEQHEPSSKKPVR